ncbi:gypsy retrotransposon integrase-like protein 1 [Plakobranchus ocellatus]|uniref:Gypsy retrotransposon integrase-like protein 1 n=1 Tax=Plakobranchus ocellatus TaxID=259542 RepID=A0AAV4D5A7_9GAST|nr:gypsy retrotransposon integrase-like protein 1 [Plakobranchus ocellatus]
MTFQRVNKIAFFEKIKGIVYRKFEDPGGNTSLKQVVLSRSLCKYVMSMAHDSITGVHKGIKRTNNKVPSNFYWPGVGVEVKRYCRSCDVCQRIGIVLCPRKRLP